MRSRDPIVGDLVEEFREVVLPARGRIRATFWFARQLASLVRPWTWGVIIGGTLSVENILTSVLHPAQRDSAPMVVLIVLSIVFFWALVGAAATRQRGRIRDAVAAAVVTAVVSMAIINATNFIRLTIVLDLVRHPVGWRGFLDAIVATVSGDDFGGFIADQAVRQLAGLIGGAIVGALAGLLGGLAALRRLPWRLDPV